MTRLIDADALIKRMPSVMDMQDVYLPIHFKELLIDEAPTVDAVPVIRCKDCTEWDKHDVIIKDADGGEWRTCRTLCFLTSPYFYCADGKRKEE